MKRSRGVTLVELMIALAIAAIFLTLAVPGFSDLLIRNRMTGLTNNLITAINYTRSEALKRGAPIRMCPGDACNGSWGGGWVVFSDANANGVADTGEVLRRYSGAPSDAYTISSSLEDASSASVGFVLFHRNGVSAHTGKFAVCHESDETSAHVINVGLTLIRISPEEAIATCEAP
jgi:type IV fimbrial biogenesis protein FimT